MKKWCFLMLLISVIGLSAGCGRKNEMDLLQNDMAETMIEEAATEVTKSEWIGRELDSVFIKDSDEDSADEDIVYLTMATTGNWEGLKRGQLMEECAEKLYKDSDGKLSLKILYDGILGTDQDLVKAVKEGTVSIVNTVPSYQSEIVPRAAILDAPGLYESVEVYNNFMYEDLYKGKEKGYLGQLRTYYKNQGIHLISSTAYTFRNLTSRGEIHTMEDIKGLKIRTMDNPYQITFWKEMGADVYPMDWSLVKTALGRSKIDAQENPLGYMISSNLIVSQKCVVLTKHMPMVSNYIMNEDQYQSLTDKQKSLLDESFKEMDLKLAEEQEAEDRKLIEDLRAKGCIIVDPSEDEEFQEELQEAIRRASRKVLDEMRSNPDSNAKNSGINIVLHSLGREDLIFE